MAKDKPRVSLSPEERRALYAARRYLSSGVEKKLGLPLEIDVYYQDPQVAKDDPELGFEKALVEWEPSLGDGPTSARFAVVDYNGDSELLAPPARWDDKALCFVHDGRVLDRNTADTLQFHQIHSWAVAQRALSYFEGPDALGRPIPWGFEGNRLIVVPHAGYGKNAFYDRASKSLQFYYFDSAQGRRTYTCLSTDIIHHELAHAVLDGVRPLLMESCSVETAAFHEFVGDLTAILLAFRNSNFRAKLAERSGGDLSAAESISNIAEEFGTWAKDRPYLRTARNRETMASVASSRSPHRVSEVMTGAMFDFVLALSRHFVERGRSPAQAFWDTIQRMQRTALQPLDLLPPVEVTFRDYALAVLRVDELAHPRDPHGYRGLMLEAFKGRGILDPAEAAELSTIDYLHDRLPLGVFHDVEDIASSRTAAYRFLDDNRRELLLPTDRDVFVADLYSAQRYARQARRLPRQTTLQYVWREDVPLNGRRFGELAGRTGSMLCGGTLVLDAEGSVLWWSRKPGPAVATASGSGRRKGEELELGEARRERFVSDIQERVALGQIGSVYGGARGFLGTHAPPFTTRTVGGAVRFELSPHLHLSEDDGPEEGERRWQISS